MSWRRGFFRLWLVLSVIYIVGAVYDHAPYTYQPAPVAISNLSDEDLKKLAQKNASASPQVTFDDLIPQNKPAVGHGLTDEEAAKLGAKPNPFAQFDPKPGDINWPYIKDSVPVIVIPPVFFLALGLAIAWIARGFRRAPV